MNALKRNNVVVRGKGSTAMMFAHGFGCDQNMWRFVAPAFEESYQTILFDHVGAGGSDWRHILMKSTTLLKDMPRILSK